MSTTWNNLSPSYTEQQGTISLGGNLLLTSGNYGTGYVEFRIENAQSADLLRLVSAQDPTAEGALSFDGRIAYMGMGAGQPLLRVGEIDGTKNGQAGQPLRVNFDNATLPGTSPVTNGDFSNGEVGWNEFLNEVDLGHTVVGGVRLPESQNYPGNTPGGDDNDDNPGTLFNPYGNYDNGVVEVDGGRLRLEEAEMRTYSYGVVHGPAVYSDTFAATAGMVLKFDWEANQINDWYHVVGYLVDMNSDLNNPTVLRALDSYGYSGSGTGTVTVTHDSNWRFYFVSGTYDASGGTLAGASMFIDNIRVEAPALTPAVVASLAAQLEYSNTSDNPTAPTKTLTVETRDAFQTIDSDTVTIAVTPVNDAAALAGNAVLRPIAEDTAQPNGQEVAQLFNLVFSDVDTGDTLGGVVVTNNAAAGTGDWEYSTDGGTTWTTIGTPSASAGLVIGAGALLRFVPAADFFGAAGALTVRALDDTMASEQLGTPLVTGDVFDTTTAEADSGLSAVDRTIGITVTAVNDLPEFTGSAPAISLADTAGTDSASANLTGNTAQLTGTVAATDVEDDAADLVYSLRGGVSADVAGDTVWTYQGRYGTLTFNADTRAWTYTPDQWEAINALPDGESVTDTFAFLAEDTQGGVGSQTLTVTLTGANDTPVRMNGVLLDQTIPNLAPWTFAVPVGTIKDAEGNGLTWTAELIGIDGVPLGTPIVIGATTSGVAGDVTQWLTFDEATRTFSGTPPLAWGDKNLNIRVTATDADGASIWDTVNVVVTNLPPEVGTPLDVVSITAPREVTSVTFGDALGGQDVDFDSSTVTVGTAATGAEVATAVAAAVNGDAARAYDASATGNVVTLTGLATGDLSDFTDGDTIYVGGGSYQVSVTDGSPSTAEVVTLTFTGAFGGSTVTLLGVTTAPIGLGVTGAEVAQAVAAYDAAGHFANFTIVQVGSTAEVLVTRNNPADGTDLGAADFSGSYSGSITISEATAGGAWSYQLPASLFDDADSPLGLVYEAYAVDANGQATAITSTPGGTLVWDAATRTLSGNGTDVNSVIEIRAIDTRAATYSGETATTQFRLIVDADTLTATVTAAAPSLTAVAFDGAGEQSYTLPASLFDIIAPPGTPVTYAITGGTLPDWLTFDANTGTFSGNPPAGATIPTLTVEATVGGASASAMLYLSATDANDPIALTDAPADQTLTAGGSLNLTIDAPFTDPDGTASGGPTQAGITHTVLAVVNGQTVTLASLGLSYTDNGVGGITITGNPIGGHAYIDFVITGTETNGGSTATASFRLDLSTSAGTTPNSGAYVANNPGSVTITGTATEGQVLTAVLGSDADGTPSNVRYQWQVRDGNAWVDIGGGRGDAATLTLAQAEVGKDVRVLAFYADAAGFVENPASAPVAVVNLNQTGSASLTPASVAPGEALRVEIADDDGIAGANPTYQWQEWVEGSWRNIAGATNDTYIPSLSQAGYTLRVVASYVDDQDTSETVVAQTTVLPIGSAAPIALDDAGTATEAGGVANATAGATATGDLVSNDYDINMVSFTVTSVRTGVFEGQGTSATVSGSTFTVAGRFGTLTVDADGSYTYTVNDAAAAVQALAPGQTLSDNFNYTVRDGDNLTDTAVLRITINGADDEPTVTGIAQSLGPINEDAATVLNLSSLVITDPENAPTTIRLSVDIGTLRAAPTVGITVSGSDTDTLTVTGTSPALLDAWLAAQQVIYLGPPNQGGVTATLSYEVSDGSDFQPGAQTTSISILSVSDAPVVDANGGITIDGAVGVAEVEVIRFLPTHDATEIRFDGVTVTIPAASTAREIAAAFAGETFANWAAIDNGNGSVTLTALTTGDRSNLTAHDFTSDLSGTPSSLVLLSSGHDETVIFLPRGEAVLIAPEITLSDIDDVLLTSVTVELSGGAQDNAQGILQETLTLGANAIAAISQLGLTLDPGSTDTRIILSGVANAQQWATILRDITYDNSNPNAFAGTRTVTISATDAAGNVSNGAVIHTSVAMEGVAVGQRILLNDIDTGLVVAQVVDDTTFIASGTLPGLVTGAGVGFFDDVNGLVVASGPAFIQGPVIATVNVQVRWAPVVDLDGTSSDDRGNDVTFIEGGSAVAIATSDATLTDQGGLIRTMTVTIDNPIDNGAQVNERLSVVSADMRAWLAARGITITGENTSELTFNAAAGVDASTMQIALRSVLYRNLAEGPDSRVDRTITVSTVDMDGNEGLPAQTEVTITPVNTAPQGTNGTVQVTEDVAYAFALSDFGFTDSDLPANQLAAVRISTLPASGALTLNGVAVTAGQLVSVADIGNGLLGYLTTRNAAGSPGASFTFQVQDDGGTANGGINLDPTPATMTMAITARNDAPVLTAGNVQLTAITEDATSTGIAVSTLFGSGRARIVDEDAPTPTGSEGAATGIAVFATTNAGPGGGTWQYSTDGGANWFDFGAVSTSAALLLGPNSQIRLVGDGANANTARFSFYAWDGAAGTAGQTADVTTRGGMTAFSTASDQVRITVTALNDAPGVDLNGAAGGTDGNVDFAPRGPAIALFGPDLALTDPDQGDAITQIVVTLDPLAVDNLFGTRWETLGTTLGGNYVSGGTTITITGNGSGASGLVGATRLTLSGTASAAHYEAALETLTYRNANPNATHGARSVTVQVTDNASTQPGGGTASSTATQTVNVRWGAVVDMSGPTAAGLDRQVTFTEGDAAIFVAASDAELAIQDGTIRQVTVTLQNPQDGVLEGLRIDALSTITALGITVTTDGSGTAPLTGATYITFTAQPVQGLDSTVFQTALRAVKYYNTDEDPAATSREVRVTSVDVEGDTGVPASTFINMAPVNDAPVLAALSANGTVAEVALSAVVTAVNLTGTLSATDVDSTFTFGATGAAADATRPGFDVSVAGDYGTLYINSASGAWEYVPGAAVDSLDAGATDTDSFTMTVTDAGGLTDQRVWSVALTGANDNPVLAVGSATIAEDAGASTTTDTGLSGTFGGSHPEGETLTFSLTGGAADTSVAGYDISRTGTYGQLFLNSATGAYLYQKNAGAIEALAASDTPTDQFTVRLTDADALSVTQTFTVSLTGRNDAPVILGVGSGSVTEQLPGVAHVTAGLTGTATTTDAELQVVTLSLSGSTSTLQAGFDRQLVTDYGTFYLNTGTGAYEFAVDAAAVDTLDEGEVVTRSASIVANDAGAASSSATFSVTLTGANDAPVLLGAPVEGGVVDGGTMFALDPIVLEFDEALAFGTGFITLNGPNGVVETFNVATGTGSAGGTITLAGNRVVLTPGSALAGETAYHLTVDATAVRDTANPALYFAGLSQPTDLNFTTGRLITVSALDISTDTGLSDSDFITNARAQTVTATLSQALITGERLLASVNGGTNWTDITSFVTGTGLSWTAATLTGSNSLRLRVEHAGGDFGPVLSQAYTVDEVGPTRRVLSNRVDISDDTGISASDFVTAEDSQTVTGALSGRLLAGERLLARVSSTDAWQDITSSVTDLAFRWTGVTLAAGTHALEFKVVDVAGNGNAVTRAYTLDTSGPATTVSAISLSADTGTSASDFVTRTQVQTIGGTLSSALAAGERLFGSVDGGQTWVDITARVTGTALAWSRATLRDGNGTIVMKVVDASGNDGAPTTQAYTLDRTAPSVSAGTITLSADTGTAGDGITSVAAQTVGATLSAPLSVGEVLQGSLDGGLTWIDLSSFLAGTALSWTGVTLPAGVGSIRLRVVDGAGNTGPVGSLRTQVDTVAPTKVVTGIDISADTGVSGTDFITDVAVQTVTATLSARLAADERLFGSTDDGATWTDITSSARGTAVTWTGAELDLGTSAIQLQVRDVAGNASATAVQAYTLNPFVPRAEVTLRAIDVDKAEGSAGTATPFIFSVELANAATEDVVLRYVVYSSGINGATAATSNDFAGGRLPAGTVTIRAGDTQADLVINVRPDRDFDQDENFTVTLSSNDPRVVFATPTVIGTIRNDDALTGTRGINVLLGSTSDDTIRGLGGADQIAGRDGDDLIYGGAGADLLSGGAGADQFVFDLAPLAADADRISDFTVGVDALVLDTDVFVGLGAGGGIALAAAAFAAGTSASDAATRVIFDVGTGRVWFDADGTGAANQVLIATLTNGAALSAGDILLL